MDNLFYITIYAELKQPNGDTIYLKYHADCSIPPNTDDIQAILNNMSDLYADMFNCPEKTVNIRMITETEYIANTNKTSAINLNIDMRKNNAIAITDSRTTKKCCPKCGALRFVATAHVTQDWELNANGDFTSTINDCVEITHQPDDDDIWACAECGYEAAGSEFNNPKHD